MKPNTPFKTRCAYVVRSRFGKTSFSKSFNFEDYENKMQARFEAYKFCKFVSREREAAEIQAKKIITDRLGEIYYG